MPQPLLKTFCNFLMKTCFSLRVSGLEHFKTAQGTVILAGNHTGYLDSLILLTCVDRSFLFMMSDVVFSWGLIGKLVRYGNILPINTEKPRAGLKQALALLRKGQSICIFPEGKLSTTGQLGAFNEGVAYLQLKSGAVIVPFAIVGGFETWAHGQKLPRFTKLAIRFGEPITPKANFSRFEVTQFLRQRVERLHSSELNRPVKTSLHDRLAIIE